MAFVAPAQPLSEQVPEGNALLLHTPLPFLAQEGEGVSTRQSRWPGVVRVSGRERRGRGARCLGGDGGAPRVSPCHALCLWLHLSPPPNLFSSGRLGVPLLPGGQAAQKSPLNVGGGQGLGKRRGRALHSRRESAPGPLCGWRRNSTWASGLEPEAS